MAITRDYVDWADGQIHYRLGGKGPGAPLVLLHQTAGSSAMYQSLMEILQGHYRMVAPDTPGFGQSDFPPPDPTVGYYAAALLEALQDLGVDRFHAFGFHTGASIACEMAVVAPNGSRASCSAARPTPTRRSGRSGRARSPALRRSVRISAM